MKKIIAIAVIVLLTATSFNANANTSVQQQNEKVLVYRRNLNPAIGVTPDLSAVGYSYTVYNSDGSPVVNGIIKTGNTFFISTQKLPNGTYRFYIGNELLQTFVVK